MTHPPYNEGRPEVAVPQSPEEAEAMARALARWGREHADQGFGHLDALEAYMMGAVIAQVTDPDYDSARDSLAEGGDAR